MSSMQAASHSPGTCANAQKLYCLGTDSCRKNGTCDTCPGKPIAVVEKGMCDGPPRATASLAFKDEDMDEGQFGGVISVTAPSKAFDIDEYVIFYGQDEKTKLK